MEEKVVIVVQARMKSLRLPGKVLLEVLERPLLSFLLERLKKVKNKDQIIVATTDNQEDDAIVKVCKEQLVPYFRGSVDDDLDRFLKAARLMKATILVRITADCPLVDPQIIEDTIDFYKSNDFDYISNTMVMTYPRGMDVEVFSLDRLEIAAKEARWQYEREHVTPYFYLHPMKFKTGNLSYKKNVSHYRLTVDTKEDFELTKMILENLYPKKNNFTLEDILDFLEKNKELSKINEGIKQKTIKEFN